MAALGDVAEIVTGKTPKTSVEEYFGGDIPFATPSELDLEAPITITPRTLTELGATQIKLVPKNSVLVCCIGSLGKVAIAGRELATNQQINSVIFNENKVVPRYGYYACRRLKQTMETVAPATTVKIISKSKFSDLEIPLPPLAEQKRIAGILDQADALRRLRRRAVDRLNTLGQAIFHEMFEDLISNPKGFPTVKISDVIAGFDTGKNLAADGNEDSKSPFRVLKVSAVTKGVYLPSESKPLPPGYEPPPSHIVHAGDLLFSRANTADLIGATAYVPDTPSGITLPDKIWRFIWDDKTAIDKLFVHGLFATRGFRYEISKRASGTSGSMKNISKPKLLGIEFGLPPFVKQKRYAEARAAVDLRFKSLEQAVQQSETLFASLQQRAFRGEL